jgi:hypothetical protein
MDRSPKLPREKTSREVLIAEVENRLQFNVFVSIFFCTLLYSFFRSIDKPDPEANKALLHFAEVTALYLMSYVVFECGRSKIPEWWLKLISGLMVFCTALYVLPTSIIAAVEAKWLQVEVLLALLSLRGIVIMALLLILPIMIGIGVGLYAMWWGRKLTEQTTENTG